MKTSLFTLLFILLGGSVFAQTNTTIITGAVQNADGAPVDYVNAAILSLPDSLATDGATCLDGKLQIETKGTGDVLLRLSVVGYADKFVPLTLQGGENNLDTITMQANTTLQAVTVSAHRPTIVSKADRTIVNVEGSVLSSALDGSDMLKKTPGLTTDAQGNTVVFGKGAPKIYIDDREVQSPTEVKMLNPQNIKSIEIIDNPPASYDAQGNAVLLIHTTKQEDAYYVRIGGTFEQSQYRSGSGFAEGHITAGKTSTDLHYGYDDENSYFSEYSYQLLDDVHKIFTNELPHRSNYQTHEYYFAEEYRPSDAHTIGIQSNGYYETDRGHSLRQTWSDLPGSQAFDSYSHFQSSSWQIGGTLYYNWKIDTLGQSFKFVADATKIHSKGNNNYTDILEGTPADAAPFWNAVNNTGTNILYSLRADYVKPIGKVWRIETGAKYYRINSDTRTIQTGSTNLNQTYKSREWNMAGYISVTTKVSDKVDLRYGLRAEYNNRRGWDNEKQYVDRSTMDWFPSFLFNYTPSEQFNVGVSYTKRISRPTVESLDPSLSGSDSLFTRRGNPDLLSSKIHVFELTFGFLHDFNVRASYNYVVHPTDFEVIRDAANPAITNVQWNNRPHSHSWVVSASYNKDVCKYWTTSVYVGVSQDTYKYTDTDGTRKNNDTPIWNFNTTNTIHLPWKLEWDIGFYWTTAGSYGTLWYSAFGNLYTTLRRDFLDGALSVRLTGNDLCHTVPYIQQSVLPGKNWGSANWGSRYFLVSITYKFGKSKHQYQSQSGSTEEQGRL